MVDWDNICCPLCNEKRKNTNKNKVWFDKVLSDKPRGKMVFYCTNITKPKAHKNRIHFEIRYFEVDDDIVSIKAIVVEGRLPK